MKKIIQYSIFVFLLIFMNANDSFSQEVERRVSQYASVSQRIGVTDVKVEYHRPKVKGREIWGKLVSYGYTYLGYGSSKAAPWRAGANECTKIEFTEDVVVEGNKLAAGRYGLYMAIFEDGMVEVIFSNNSTMWGAYDYKQEDDALRVKVKSGETGHTEALTYEFLDVEPNSTVLNLRWGNKGIPIKIIATK